MMSLPRVLHLDRDGILSITTLPELNRLRAGKLPAPQARQCTLPQANGEMFYAGQPGSPLTVTMNHGATEIFRVSYSPETRIITVDGKTIVLQPQDLPTVHAFVDASVLEVILSHRIGYTKRFYFESAVAPDIEVRVSGPSAARLDAWKLAAISGDRLTTSPVGPRA